LYFSSREELLSLQQNQSLTRPVDGDAALTRNLYALSSRLEQTVTDFYNKNNIQENSLKFVRRHLFEDSILSGCALFKLKSLSNEGLKRKILYGILFCEDWIKFLCSLPVTPKKTNFPLAVAVG